MTRRKSGRRPGPSIAPDIIALNAAGMTGKAIAERLGCSGAHVSKILHKHRTFAIAPHRGLAHWQAPDRPTSCMEWVQTPKGLQPCGQPKHKVEGEVKGQCFRHFESSRPS